MSHSVNLEDVQSVLRRAFVLSGTARRERIAGRTGWITASLENHLEKLDREPFVELQSSILKEGTVRLLCALGRSYRETNQFDEARDTYTRAVKLDPDNEFAWYGIAGLYRHLKLKYPEKPMPKSFEEYAFVITGDRNRALLGAGIAYYVIASFGDKGQRREARIEDDKRAIACWSKILKADPEDERATFLIAKAHYVRSEDGLACQFLRPLLQKYDRPEYTALYLAAADADDPLVGVIHETKADQIEALQAMAATLQRDPVRIWALQQEMRKEAALSDGNFRTVWQVAERMGVARLRPVNDGAKEGMTGIAHGPVRT